MCVRRGRASWPTDICGCICLHLMRASLRVSHEVNSHLNFFIPWIPFHSKASLSLSLSPLPVLAEECANISSPALLAITSSLQRPQADIRPIAIYVSRHLKHSIRPSQDEILNPTCIELVAPISLGMSNLNLAHTSQDPPPTHADGCLGTSLIGHFPGAQCCRPV